VTEDDALLLADDIARTWHHPPALRDWWTQQLRTLPADDAADALEIAKARYRNQPDGPTWRQFTQLAVPAPVPDNATDIWLDIDSHKAEINRLRQQFQFLNH
jgi:hypothetical protein